MQITWTGCCGEVMVDNLALIRDQRAICEREAVAFDPPSLEQLCAVLLGCTKASWRMESGITRRRICPAGQSQRTGTTAMCTL